MWLWLLGAMAMAVAMTVAEVVARIGLVVLLISEAYIET